MRIGARSGRMCTAACVFGVLAMLGVAALPSVTRPVLARDGLAQDGRRVPAAFSRLRPATVNVEAALQAAAHALFRPPRGTVFRIEHTGRRQELDLAAEIDTYSVSSEEAGPLGSFTRFRCWPSPDSTVDLAVRLEDGGIKSAVALRPLVINGAACPALPAALAQLPEVPAAVWAPGVAALFRALTDLEPCLAGPAAPEPLDLSAATAALAELERVRPPLLPGSAFPVVQAADLEGRPFDSSTMTGRATLVIAASVKHEMSRRVIEEVGRYLREHPGRLQPVWLLADRPAAIAAYRKQGGDLPGVILPDVSRAVRDALRISTLPTLLVFDTTARLVAYRRAPWPAHEELAAQLDRAPLAPSSAAPSPSPAPVADSEPAPEEAPRRGKQKPKRQPNKKPRVGAAPSPSPELPPPPPGSAQPQPPTTASLPAIEPTEILAAWRKLAAAASPVTSVSSGGPAVVRRTVQRFDQATALQRVDILDARDEVLETLVRVVVAGAGTRLDLLVSADSGAVRAVEALAPPRVEGRDLTHLKALFAAVAHRGMDTHGPALARLFFALSRVARGAPAPTASASPAYRLVLATPGVAVGQPLPAFALTDAGGRAVRGAELRGGTALVVLASRDAGEPAADVREELARGAAARGVRLVILLVDAESSPIPVPHLPFAYGLDAAGVVLARGSVNGRASVGLLLDAIAR